MIPTYAYEITGDGFTVTVQATQDYQVSSIVGAIMDATLGAGDAIEVRRVA